MKKINLGDIFTTTIDLQFGSWFIPTGTKFEINEIAPMESTDYKIIFDIDDSDYVYGDYEPCELVQIVEMEEIREWTKIKSKLINKKAYITNKESIYYNEWGIIKDYDGDHYYIAIANGTDSIPIFQRDEFYINYKINNNK